MVEWYVTRLTVKICVMMRLNYVLKLCYHYGFNNECTWEFLCDPPKKIIHFGLSYLLYFHHGY